MPHVRTAVALAALGALALTGCSESGSAGNGAAVRSGDAAACPGEVVDVVVSVGQWGDVVGAARRRLRRGDHDRDQRGRSTRTTSSRGRPTSPRSPAPTSWCSTAPATTRWAENVVETPGRRARRRQRRRGRGRRRHGEDPHLWYDPAIVEQMSGAITEALVAASPDAGAYLADRAAAPGSELQPYRDAIE